LSRPDLIKKLKEKNPNISKVDLEDIVDIFCKEIEVSLKKGYNVEFRDFGTFFVKKIKEKHSARNPKSGQLIYVPEKNKVRFRASKKLKKFINK
tara:strand:+ start:1306 stop:1587 length:282 start_codon:yes stop_codon:yes gene_type:complete